jgi:2-dehydro-3-deoxyphosphooctonate aldolase (KDO 8-P synthase)
MKQVKVGNVTFSNDLPFALIAGPCQMESAAHGMEMASAINEICEKLSIPYVFKASFDKANRTSVNGIRGMGLERAMRAFSDIKTKYGCPVITDIHEPWQCAEAAKIVDILQIPAFLSQRRDIHQCILLFWK